MPRLFVALAIGTSLLGCRGPDDGFNVYNIPPAVTINDPVDEAVFDEGETIVFRGIVDDDGDLGDLDVRWLSTLQDLPTPETVPDAGGNVEYVIASLVAGDHVITLAATDLFDAVGEGRITVHIEGIPDVPDLTVVHPTPGEQGLEGAPYRFEVLVTDVQDDPEDLLVTLESDIHPGNWICDMLPDANGVGHCEETLALGEHLLTFRAEDSDGFTAQKQVIFYVVSRNDYDADGDTYTPNTGDCDDNDITIHPNAPEICDGKDNDCNPATPAEVGSECYDDDGDGYCEVPPCINASSMEIDCNDVPAAVGGGLPGAQQHPNRAEICDGKDQDCDTLIDEGTSCYDDDGDGFCESPPCVNAAGQQQDCDDGNRDVRPGQNWAERCLTPYDDNCNGQTNEQNGLDCTVYYVDNDGDSYYRAGAQSQCWCAPNSTFSGTNPGDCYDQNASAKPGQTGWFTGQRGDGSFDYNCVNGAEKRYTASATQCFSSSFSCSGQDGWVGYVPQCGGTGTWQNDCDFDWAALLLGCGAPCVIACGFGGTSGCFQCIAGYCPSSLICDPSYDGSITQQSCH